MDGGHSLYLRGQSAIEYLVTYGWAMMIIIAAVGMLYFYVIIPMSIPPNNCVFIVGVSCDNYGVGMSQASTNTVNVSLMLSNPNYYPIKDPVMVINSQGSNYSATCVPSFVNPGATFVCSAGVYDNFGNHLKANVYIKEYNCGLSKYGEFNGTCADPPIQIYKGAIYDTFSKNITAKPTALIVNPSTLTLAAGNAYSINSTFEFAGSPTPSVTVNYTLNNTDARLQNSKGFTGSSGVASDTLYALHTGTVKVTVSFDGYSANSIVTIS
ncbi:MAG: hypothetical protein M1465_03165 [Candidatus Marsarchaeota archaeon]|nr:hypothetical protein [Candidatus Marsarchaeota archaeon]